jgi:hypothetical protein
MKSSESEYVKMYEWLSKCISQSLDKHKALQDLNHILNVLTLEHESQNNEQKTGR